MNTVTKTALSNIRHNRSRNILIGIAIVLTSVLLFLVPSIGYNMIQLEFASINKIYPSWHGMYRNVPEQNAKEIGSRQEVKEAGLRSDPGILTDARADIMLIYTDETCAGLNRLELQEGRFPQKKDEIVVSREILKQYGLKAEMGDRVKLPYQIDRGEGLDYRQEGEFTICGFIEDSEENIKNQFFTALVSREFYEQEVPKEERLYRVYIQLNDMTYNYTDELEKDIKGIGEAFGVSEDNTVINTEYLTANYVDPSFVPAIIGIMLIVVLAGVITIYSIYYISMVHRIQEYGKLRAIGTTRRQLRQIVFREGFFVAAAALPVGLLLGSLFVKPIFLKMISFISTSNEALGDVMTGLIQEKEVTLFYPWIFLLAAAVTILTVYLSLLKPMKIVGKISAIEAIRFQNQDKKSKSRRKGFESLNLIRLTRANLSRNKKRTAMTIAAMSFTGILLIVVSTVLSCANPVESANAGALSDYEVLIKRQDHDKEHPELAWAEIQKNNPLNEALRQQIEALPGVTKTEILQMADFRTSRSEEEESEGLVGMPEELLKEALKYVTEGHVTYEELQTGDKVLVDESIKRWYPDLQAGSTLMVQIQDGDTIKEKELTVAAAADLPYRFISYGDFLMGQKGVSSLVSGRSDYAILISAREKMDKELLENLEGIVSGDERLGLRSWQEEYKKWERSMGLISAGCYAFLGILGVICITNLMNTMINSIYMRKKELGMMQAIGLSERQMLLMLEAEGMFYTIGALLVSLGIGSLAGCGVFLYAKNHGLFNIRFYHYPVEAVLVMTGVVLLVQIILSLLIGKSLKKQSLIEMIHFSE